MRNLLRQRFNRKYVLWPMLATIALVATAFMVTEARRSDTRDLVRSVNEEQTFLADVTELLNASYEAESAQRGYILTGYDAYLAPYGSAVKTARDKIAALVARKVNMSETEAAEVELIEHSFGGKLQEMESTINMRRSGYLGSALSVLNSDVGLNHMREIREAADRLHAQRAERLGRAIREWSETENANTIISGVMTLFTLFIIMLVGLLLSREISRRAWIAAELDGQVRERTAELADLSTQLLRIGETEKAALSRELHDELGGLLVAMKLDLGALKKTLPPGEGVAQRAQRLDASIDAGIDLKRRVIENLRPTLLDNLGLFAALRWLIGEASAQSGVAIEFNASGEEPQLPADVSIAIFRVVQETLTNMLRHARASGAAIEVATQEGGMEITIRDNGVGLPADALKRSGSHGLKQMRFRMTAIGGEVDWADAPGGGTVTRVRYQPSAPA
ncbi:MAG: CHASE3 domain-containing protein [Steroidobacteraceae bacterium]